MSSKILRDLFILLAIFGIVWLAIYQFSKPVSLPQAVLNEDIRDKLKDFLEEQIENQYTVIDDHLWKENINEIMERLLSSAELKNSSYQIKVIDSEMVNAFVTVGNTIYVFRGLLEFCENHEELASVIAHEIGHIDLNHIESRLLTEFGLTVLSIIVSGGDPTLATRIVKEVSSGAYSRKNENEADEFALKVLLKSKIDPAHLGIFFKRLKDKHKDDLFPDFELLSSHPVMEKRIRKSFEYNKQGLEIMEFNTPWQSGYNNTKNQDSE